MELKLSYGFTGSTRKLADTVRMRVSEQLEGIVREAVDGYLKDLMAHMGGIEGSGPYSDRAVKWSALDAESLENEGTFWYDTGSAKAAVVAHVKFDGTKFEAFVGIQRNSPEYKTVLWNELGFTAKNGRLIRRPLFLPLADIHLGELKKRVQEELSNQVVNIRVKL